MDEKSLAKKLREEGFAHTYVWEDRPHAKYSDHTHAGETAHIVLTGEMTMTIAAMCLVVRRKRLCRVGFYGAVEEFDDVQDFLLGVV